MLARPSLPPQFARMKNADPKHYAPLLASVLTPAAATAYAMAFWRFAADMNWVGQFFIAEGLLSRWQVWLALAAGTQVAAQHLNRVGRQGDDSAVAP